MSVKRSYISCLVLLACLLSGCTPEWKEELAPVETESGQETAQGRDNNTDTRKVLLLYSAGYNSLANYLRTDIEELSNGWLPKQRRADDVLLVYSHLALTRGDYSTPTEPVLFRIYRKTDDTIVRDTLVVYDRNTISSTPGQLNNVLSYIKEEFPAKSYGMVVSSHATGYLPSGFYSAPDHYEFQQPQKSYGRDIRSLKPVPMPYVEPEYDPGLPEVKSIGQDLHSGMSYETDLKEFAQAIPMKMEYILFDACLMGGVEVAYELAEKCDRIGFSLTEVLADGFNYSTLAYNLLGNRQTSDTEAVCRDYFEQYEIQTGVNQSATISLVDCRKIQTLADVCSDLFAKYRDEIASVSHIDVQRYYRSSHHWFYDLRSILRNAGVSAADLERLDAALEECIIYNRYTPSFMGAFDITECCGLSMYLPSYGHDELSKYYRTLSWNKATGLVK